MNAKELRWLANELNKWRVPVDVAVLRRQAEFFPVLVDIIEQRQLSARQRANALRLIHVMCGQGWFERTDVLVRLTKSLIVDEERELRDAAATVVVHQFRRQRSLPQLRPQLSPAEVHGLLAQAESLGLSEEVLSTVKALAPPPE